MQICLGLDVGTYSIKAVVLRVDAHQHVIEEMNEQTIVFSPDYDEKTAYVQALRALLASLKESKFDAIYSTLGCQNTILKKFELHNINRSDRQKVIENEFDLLGVFDLSEYLVEYHTIDFKPKYAKIIGILINKSAAKQLIDVLSECALNVRVIDIDNIVYLNIGRFLYPSSEALPSSNAQMMIDIGHSKTTLTVIQNNRVINSRMFQMGGKYLTEQIQSQLNITYKEAHALKHVIQSQPSHASYDSVTQIIQKFFDEVSLEIKRTIKSMTSAELIPFENIFIVGGGSKFLGIQDIFEKNTGIPASHIEELKGALKFNVPGKVDFSVFSLAISSALRGDFHKDNSKINIRHGELALMNNYEKIINEAINYLKLIGIFFIILLSVYLVRYFLFNAKINEIKSHFRKDVIEIFSQEPRELRLLSAAKNWDFSVYSAKALKLVESTLKEKKHFISDMDSNNTPFPIAVLHQISTSIPADVNFEVVDFRLIDNTLYIEADTTDAQSLEKIMRHLKSVKILEQVENKSSSVKPGSNGKILHFIVTANVLKEEG